MGMTIDEWKLNDRKDEYLRIGDIVERFNHIDEVYGHTPWTLEQIYSNLNILVGFEAIPKADYEARLKADMVAMLTEIQLEIEECVDGAEGSPQFEQGVSNARVQVAEIIQQKINELKEVEE